MARMPVSARSLLSAVCFLLIPLCDFIDWVGLIGSVVIE